MHDDSRNKLLRSAVALAAASMLLLAACADNGALDVSAAAPGISASEARTLDPALNNLEGVTQHG